MEFFSEATIGQIYSGAQVALLVTLLLIVLVYGLLLGDMVYHKRKTTELGVAFVCEFLAGTLYTTFVARLLKLAFTLEVPYRFPRVLCTVSVFLFATTAAFVAILRVGIVKSSDVRFKPK